MSSNQDTKIQLSGHGGLEETNDKEVQDKQTRKTRLHHSTTGEISQEGKYKKDVDNRSSHIR